MIKDMTAGLLTRIDPAVRFFWEGRWTGGYLEMRRLLYDCELVYVSRGMVDMEIDGQRHRLGPHGVAIIPPATVHQSFVPSGGEVIRHCVHFDWTTGGMANEAPLFTWHGDRFSPNLVHALPSDIATRLPAVTSFAEQRELIDGMEFALRLLRSKHSLGPRQLGLILAWIIDPPTHFGQNRGRAQSLEQSMAAVLRHIDDCYHEPLTHRDLCRVGNIGSTSLCRMFQSMLGTRPLIHLRRVRIRHAQRLLGELSHPVKDIAGMVGFPDANYFSRIFHKETGLSPVEFRQRAIELQQDQHHLLVPETRQRTR